MYRTKRKKTADSKIININHMKNIFEIKIQSKILTLIMKNK